MVGNDQRLDGLAGITATRRGGLISKPPLAGRRPIVGWALTTFGKPWQRGRRQNVLFLFRRQPTDPDVAQKTLVFTFTQFVGTNSALQRPVV